METTETHKKISAELYQGGLVVGKVILKYDENNNINFLVDIWDYMTEDEGQLILTWQLRDGKWYSYGDCDFEIRKDMEDFGEIENDYYITKCESYKYELPNFKKYANLLYEKFLEYYSEEIQKWADVLEEILKKGNLILKDTRYTLQSADCYYVEAYQNGHWICINYGNLYYSEDEGWKMASLIEDYKNGTKSDLYEMEKFIEEHNSRETTSFLRRFMERKRVGKKIPQLYKG